MVLFSLEYFYIWFIAASQSSDGIWKVREYEIVIDLPKLSWG